MCFYLNERSKIQKAKKDIVCWKELVAGSDNYYSSPYYPERYKEGKIVRAKALKDEQKTSNRRIIKHLFVIKADILCLGNINAGIHTFRKRGYVTNGYFASAIAKCIIPKGTEYCANATEYVSLKVKAVKIYDL